MESLFDTPQKRPLADRLRPQNMSEVIGQDHLLDKNGAIGRMLARKSITSFLMWGPPGCGKTTIARLLAKEVDLVFEPVSAIFTGIQDLKKIFERARENRLAGKQTLLFVDEVHRFNRAQQDVFLPYVEDGTVILVGATTENPSFELNAALLSRLQVFVLDRLDDKALESLLQRSEKAMGAALPLTSQARRILMELADGDGRYLLTLADELFALEGDKPLERDDLFALLQKRAPIYDKAQEGHYNLISALHKSLRGSDPDAAMYWFARMLEGGEDPLYIVRRLIRFAVEDIGMADPQALLQAKSAWEAYERLGSPEGELAIAQAILYLATAPKSNAVYKAYSLSRRVARQTGSLMPPHHILNAPTQLMKDMGYGKGYAYDHDSEQGFSGQNYFPDDMPRADLYQPTARGYEEVIRKRIQKWNALRQQKIDEGK